MMSRRSMEFDAPQFFDFAEFSQSSVPCSTGSETWSGQACLVSPPRDDVFLPDHSSIKTKSVAETYKNKTDVQKIALQKNIIPKRFSKSDGAINKIGKSVESGFKRILNLPIGSHKRSLSESCVKSECKKRTITANICSKQGHCSRNKNVKTTEELELEKIAQLQQQTRFLLRANECRLRKMKLQPRPSIIQRTFKLTSTNKEPPKNMKDIRKEPVQPVERVNPMARNFRLPAPFRPKSSCAGEPSAFKVPKMPIREAPIDRMRTAVHQTNPRSFGSRIDANSIRNNFMPPKPQQHHFVKEEAVEKIKSAAYLMNPKMHAPKVLPDNCLKDNTNLARRYLTNLKKKGL